MQLALSVVPLQPNSQTVAELELLLQRARAGDVIGFAYVTLGIDGQYSGNVVGTARTLPIYMRGLVQALGEAVTKGVPL